MHAGKLRDICAFCLLAVALVAIPLAISMRVSECNYVKWVVLDLVVAGALTVALANVCFSKGVAVVKDRLHGAVLLWLLMAAASALLSRYPYASYNALWRVGMAVGLYVATLAAIKRECDMWIVATLCAMVTLLVCLHVVLQLLGWDIASYRNAPLGRVAATLGNPNFLAGFLMLMFWFLAGVFLDTRSRVRKVLLGLLCGFALFCIFWTKTKGAWIAFLVSVVAMLLWFGSGWRFVVEIRRSVRIRVVCIIVLLFLGGVVLFRGQIQGRAATLESSVAVRKVYWAGAVKLIKDRPLFGHGNGTFQVVYPEGRPRDFRASGSGWNLMHAHSEPLQIWVEMGVLGFAVFCYLLWAFYSGILRSLRRESQTPFKGMQAGIMFGASALLLHNCVDISMREPTCFAFFWIFLGLSAAIRSLSCAPDERRIAFGWGRIPILLRGVFFLGLVVLLGLLLKAHTLDPWRAELLYRQGFDFREYKLLKAALRPTERAIALNPSSLRAYYQQGYCYHELRMYDEALRAYQNLERLAPNFGQLQYNMAAVYSHMGRWEEAAERFIRAEKSGVAPEWFSVEDMLDKARAEDTHPERYLATLRKVAELTPDDPMVHNRLGICWGERGDFPKAAREFQKAVELDDSYLAAKINLASTYYRQKDYAKAIEVFIRILEIDPELREVRVNLARAYYLTGQRDKAEAEWNRAMQENSKESEVFAYPKSPGRDGKP